VHWDSLDQVLTSYLRSGSPSDGGRLYKILQGYPHSSYGYPIGGEDFFTHAFKFLPVLRIRLLHRDTVAIKLLFAFGRFSDGAAAEYILGCLSHLITVDPALFLAMMKSNNALGAEARQAILPFAAAPPDSDNSVWIKGIRDRIAALKRVHQPNLRAARDSCIQTLNEILTDSER
jgi:hypothetical protein